MTGDHVYVSEASERTSSSLLTRVRGHDPEAWRRLVTVYAPLVYHWCRRAGLQEEDAADVGQEVFQAAYRAIAAFHRDRPGDSFRGWLRTITKNKLRDFARRRLRAVDGVGGSAAHGRLLDVADPASLGTSDPAEDEGGGDEQLLLRKAIELVLSEFKADTRQAFLRVVVERRSPADVARELGMTVNAVYLAKSRVKRRLREEFEGLLEV